MNPQTPKAEQPLSETAGQQGAQTMPARQEKAVGPQSSKYGAITTASGTFIDGEPVFILRASDATAIRAIAQYHGYLAGIEDPTRQRSPEYLSELEREISRFASWQAANGDSVKLPD